MRTTGHTVQPLMAHVLCIGYLRNFLEARSALLRDAGHSVHCAATAEEASAYLSIGNYDVCIFGHGVPEEDRNNMAARVRLTSPNVAMIFLYSGSIKKAEMADAILNVHGNLPDLVQTVEYLTSKKREECGRISAVRRQTG
jgi:CheY-like chemotaxis protein